MELHLWNVQNRQTQKGYRDRKEISDCLDLAGMGRLGMMAKGGGSVLFWDSENVLKLVVVMDMQLYQYTKSHRIVHHKRVNFMVSINKTFSKKQIA